MKYGIPILILWCAVALANFARGSDSYRIQNLRDCVDGIGPCDQSLLTTTQAKQITDLERDRNLLRRLTGFVDCDHAALTPTEAHQVAEANIDETFWPARPRWDYVTNRC
jgi:hypothetical protein